MRQGAAAIALPLVLGALELFHPTWSGDAIAQAVAAVGLAWIALHALLIVGYASLVWTLWPPDRLARTALAVFVASNTTFLAIDGLVVGILAIRDPAAADGLWSSPVVTVLANLTGAAWSAALLTTALTRRRSAPILAGAAITWLAFTLGAVLPVVGMLSHLTAAALAFWLVYTRGASAAGAALVVFAATLRQHVGPEAALGMACLALAAAVRERSAPAAGSPP